MLNKELCQECINEWMAVGDNFWWYEADEKRWGEGYVICGGNISRDFVTLGPSLKCRYYLEQIMVNQDVE